MHDHVPPAPTTGGTAQVAVKPSTKTVIAAPTSPVPVSVGVASVVESGLTTAGSGIVVSTVNVTRSA